MEVDFTAHGEAGFELYVEFAFGSHLCAQESCLTTHIPRSLSATRPSK